MMVHIPSGRTPKQETLKRFRDTTRSTFSWFERSAVNFVFCLHVTRPELQRSRVEKHPCDLHTAGTDPLKKRLSNRKD